MARVVDPADVPERFGSAYPAHLQQGRFDRRFKQPLGDAAALTHFGVNLVRMEPGSWSALRHWHTREDEFVYVLEGELVLVTDAGEQVLRPGMAAGFAAGDGDGHHLVNRSDRTARYLEVGDRSAEDDVHYPDADLFVARRDGVVRHKNGDPY